MSPAEVRNRLETLVADLRELETELDREVLADAPGMVEVRSEVFAAAEDLNYAIEVLNGSYLGTH